ncbi:NAD(P)-dependent oxidoreductase [Adhaeribacter pallidiroseus]|uniref:NAD(P)-binding domain-containing protein n=1 Tax=Adhaeribacter pallidiroseus TaxID=2072847 RepID=A0A369QHE7_9BACT|nr:SDR family oxidoreductase [Adhaeribacter pallidiroseus]RDC64321.1 hypothetical protein AHMF7616_02934 [Adhaeribacter pallidiroseus]
MKIVIFGATGGTGRHLVEQALADGHSVTAFVRDPAKLPLNHKNLKIVPGDVLHYSTVEPAVVGQEAVLSALGSGTQKDTLRSTGTRHIIQAMEKLGVKRLVCETSLGYGDSRQVLDRTPFYFKYLIVPLLLRHGFADHELQESYIKQSTLDWIIARPGNLTDGQRTGVYRHGFPANDQKITVKISRADVADFMLKQLTDNTYLRQTPGLSY